MESNQASTQQSVCPKCGKSVQSDFTRCPYCGAKLGASSNNLKDFKEKAKSVFQSIVRVAKAHKKATIGVVVALVVIIALIPIISAITSPFNSLKANNVSVGYQTAEEVEKQFGKPTDVLTDTYSSLPASCDEVWVYYPDSIDNQIKSINKMLENANSFADLDKADKEYQKLTEKKFKQVVIGISDDKLVFYSLNTQAMYNEEDLFATKDSKELSKCTFNKTMVCRDTTVSDNKITFTAKFTDGSIFIGKVSGYSRVDEKNPKVEFSCPWYKLSLTLNIVDHYFNTSCTCKNCGLEDHDLDNDCKCSRCNNTFHNIHGCECVNCDYNTHTPDADCVCTICHQSAHIINKNNCTCSQCGESFHKLDQYYSCTRCNNGLKYEIIDDHICTITDCVGLSGSISIPASYKGVPVTKIGNDAFRGCGSLTSIILPDSVTSIEEYAFSSCTSLTSITIPSSVTSIDSSAFIYCSSLTRLDITDMAKWCAISFSSSSENPLSYAHNLYLNGELVTDLVIPDSVTSIESYAFYNCTSLTSITIPDSVTSIGDSSFYGCDSLTKVDITDLAKWCAISFGNADANPLAYAENLYLKGELVTDLVIPDSVTYIGYTAFQCCTSLTSITIPDSVTSIGDRAFSYCSSLTSITIPDSVTSIGDSSFYGCDSLTKVDITDLAKWCAISFGNADANPLAYAENLYLKGELLTDLVIPDSVTYIGYTAFSGCSSLTSITIPSSMTSIGAWSFSGCSNLTSITIPNSVTSIGAGAFDGCRRLTSITITDSVTSIGELVFSGCRNLTSITIPDSVTSIGNMAFSGCSSLTNITIPNSVTSIGYNAFYDCSSLTSITIPDSVTSIGASAFSICSISRIDITSLFKWCSISFGGMNFGGISSAFDSQYDLYLNGELVTNLVIPDSVTSIGRYAFYNCISLTSITIPNSVTNIGSYAFYNCHNLTSITISESVTGIEDFAFSDCSSLTSITIPNSVTRIGNYAFGGCISLTSITIGNGVTSIGSAAFLSCSSLTTITFQGTRAQWNAISKGRGWDSSTGNYTIYCIDGTISKS